MKKLFLFLLLPFLSFGQNNPLHEGEFIISLINYGYSWNVTFTATAIDAKWDENYHLTSGYESASVSLISPFQTVAYFDLIIVTNAGVHPVMAIGLYKINAIVNGVVQAYFYMDWRTCGYYQSPDVYFKYDITNKRFRNSENTQTINGTTQTVWDLVSGIDHVTSGLELYLSITNQNANPRLEWNPTKQTSWTGYKIYRSINTQGGGPGSFGNIATVGKYDNTFIDEDLATGKPWKVYYKVIAVNNGNEEGLFSNIGEIGASGFVKQNYIDVKNNFKFYLKQNYPNPFNPTTTISYRLAEAGFVNLKVYNMIGETVAELVNLKQEEGSYTIEFNAESLPSGIYIYKMQTENYSDVKKMILIR